jgi:hypothetical protein
MSIIELNCWFLLNKIECFIELGINLLPTTYTDHTLKFIIITHPMITYKSVLELYSWTDRAFGTAGLWCFGIHFIFSTTSMYVRKLQHVLSAIKKITRHINIPIPFNAEKNSTQLHYLSDFEIKQLDILC